MRLVLHVERLLWAAGALCFGLCLLLGVKARGYQKIAAEIGKPQQVEGGTAMNDKVAATGVIGRIEIPALALSAPITSDYDVNSLRMGVGHIPGTAVPGGLGTVGLAGHRDSFFRPLRKVAPDMEIRLIDKSGTYHYAVDSTEIVDPDKVEVLDIVARPELTLITCFPFDYVGAAPRRFIVHAHLLSASPDRVSAIH
jgi:sortase A